MNQLNINKYHKNFFFVTILFTRKVFSIILLIGILSACASKGNEISDLAEKIGTDSIYHCALNWEDKDCECPEDIEKNGECSLRSELQYDGILLGIEKSDKVGACHALKGNGLREPSDTTLSSNNKSHLKKLINDKKSMYLSHAVEYPSKKNDGGIFYNSYEYINIDDKCTGDYPNRESFNDMNPPTNLYLRGEKALWGLKKRIKTRLKNGRNEDSPYTHIILMSMGWHNDQPESLYRYNKITEHLIETATANNRPNFKPFIIGISWPSAWCSACYNWFSELAGHIVSYVNKANDADEIGYTLLNRVLNRVLLELKQEAGVEYDEFKLVTIGHSMGARIVTRAVFSEPLLVENPSEKTKIDLVIGIQGAFSVNRFIKPSPSVSETREGGPYSDYDKMANKFIMTWSSQDKANPVSRFLNGSKHIGGYPGYEETQKVKKSYPFTYTNWPTGKGYTLSTHEQETCFNIPKDHSVSMINMSSVVDDHNDILDEDMGRFLWCAISQFAT